MALAGAPQCDYAVFSGGRWGQPEGQLCESIWGYEQCLDSNGPSGPVKQPAWDGVERFCDPAYMVSCTR